MDLKKKKDGTAHVAKSPPKTFQENNWNYKHALSVVFHSNSSPKSSIIIFINGVRFSSESENKDFSLEICFFPTSLLVPSNGIQGGEDVPEYRRKKKKSPHITPGPQTLACVAGQEEVVQHSGPCFCTSAAVGIQLLAM